MVTYTTAGTGSATTYIWNTWTSGNCTTSATTYSTNETWTGWTSGTACASTNTVWYTWTAETGEFQVVSPRVEPEEERTARLEREAVECKERAKAAEEREKRAMIFLQLVLNEKQQKELKEKNCFELSVVGGKKYRINKGQINNVQELDDKTGLVKRRLCFQPKDDLHDYDAMAIQKLALECIEEEVLKVANFS
jgi:hypothetical protein